MRSNSLSKLRLEILLLKTRDSTTPHMMRSVFLAIPCRKVTEGVTYVQWASVAELPPHSRKVSIYCVLQNSHTRCLSRLTHKIQSRSLSRHTLSRSIYRAEASRHTLSRAHHRSHFHHQHINILMFTTHFQHYHFDMRTNKARDASRLEP
jgi:hypothetical protein